MKEVVKKIQDFMIKHNMTLSVAESCTSGKIASLLTSNDGASQFFNGGIVCYQNFVKEQLLNVNPITIKNHDVVSKEVAIEMVKGIVSTIKSDCGISVTGYASKSNNPNIPNGTIFIGYNIKGEIFITELHLDGTREKNIDYVVKTALNCFYDLLLYIYMTIW